MYFRPCIGKNSMELNYTMYIMCISEKISSMHCKGTQQSPILIHTMCIKAHTFQKQLHVLVGHVQMPFWFILFVPKLNDSTVASMHTLETLQIRMVLNGLCRQVHTLHNFMRSLQHNS